MGGNHRKKERKKERGPLLTLINVASFPFIFLPSVHQTQGSKIKVLLFYRRINPLHVLRDLYRRVDPLPVLWDLYDLTHFVNL
jgi:hypothetical protein